jgi:hypothetical protein
MALCNSGLLSGSSGKTSATTMARSAFAFPVITNRVFPAWLSWEWQFSQWDCKTG